MISSLEKLISESISFEEPVEVFIPRGSRRCFLKPLTTKVVNKYERKYDVTNGILHFVHLGILYVIPFNPSFEKTLCENGFMKELLPVYITPGDYPVKEAARWQKLLTNRCN